MNKSYILLNVVPEDCGSFRRFKVICYGSNFDEVSSHIVDDGSGSQSLFGDEKLIHGFTSDGKEVKILQMPAKHGYFVTKLIEEESDGWQPVDKTFFGPFASLKEAQAACNRKAMCFLKKGHVVEREIFGADNVEDIPFDLIVNQIDIPGKIDSVSMSCQIHKF